MGAACALAHSCAMPSDPIRDLWSRLRRLGTKVEEEGYEFTEEEEHEEEPRGRNTLIALINAFLTLWKASQATAAERTLGILGFAGLLWLIVGDRGLGIRRPPLRIAASTFAVLWFVPGIIAAVWTFTVNMGVVNLRRIRTWPLILVFAMGGLIGFRGVCTELAAPPPRPSPREATPACQTASPERRARSPTTASVPPAARPPPPRGYSAPACRGSPRRGTWRHRA